MKVAIAVVAVGLSACGATQTRKAPLAEPVRGHPPLASAIGRVPTYRFWVSDQEAAFPLDDAGTQGVLRSGQRVLISPEQQANVATRTGGSLMRAAPLPSRIGGGFLFWGNGGVYHAPTFLGDLAPVTTYPGLGAWFAFGHDTVLISAAGFHRQYDFARKKFVPLSPPGVVDLAASDDGRVIAVDAAGQALISIDGQKSWKVVTDQVGSDVVALHGEPSAVWFEKKSDAVALEVDGKLTKRAALEQAAPSKEGRADLEPLALLRSALTSGVPWGEGRALVASKNQLVVVDLAQGTAVGAPRDAAPNDSDCTVLSPENDALVVCSENSKTFGVLSHAMSEQARSEKTFVGVPWTTVARGTLVVDAACDGRERAGVACVRRRDGVWSEIDLRTVLSAGSPTAPFRVMQWVPSAEGAVVALVARESQRGATDWALASAAHGLMKLDRPLPGGDVLFQNLREEAHASWRARQPRGAWSDWVLLADGSLRTVRTEGAVRISPAGHVEIEPHEFDEVTLWDGYVFASQKRQHYWQSLDWGAHLEEIAGPAHDAGPEGPTCSAVGCSGWAWIRTGWPSEAPLPRHALEIAPAPEPAPMPARPSLVCQETGDATRKEEPEPTRGIGASSAPAQARKRNLGKAVELTYTDQTGGDQAWPGGRLRGLFEVPPNRFVPSPGGRRLHLQPLFWYTMPFDLAPVATFALAPELERAVAQITQRGLFHGSARPILSTRPGEIAGMLLQGEGDKISFCLHDRVEVHLLPQIDAPAMSSFAGAGGQLFVAVARPGDVTAVVSAVQGTEVLALPPATPVVGRHEAETNPARKDVPPFLTWANPDVIAVAPDGQLAVLRLPSGGTPATVDDPALILVPGQPPLPLAPWSTLELMSSPRCQEKQTGYRAIVQSDTSWLKVLPEDPTPRNGEGGMSAMVRWSAVRVCLEALDMHYGHVPAREGEPPIQSNLVARFVGPRSAAAVTAMSIGVEYRRPATCSLAR